jgi:hypothetical protein
MEEDIEALDAELNAATEGTLDLPDEERSESDAEETSSQRSSQSRVRE